jgi:hypothetical protein
MNIATTYKSKSDDPFKELFELYITIADKLISDNSISSYDSKEDILNSIYTSNNVLNMFRKSMGEKYSEKLSRYLIQYVDDNISKCKFAIKI